MKKRLKTKKLLIDFNQNGKYIGYSFKRPKIPEGYRHVMGKWNNGFVVERISDKSQFVWIPVGFLPNNGTRDGINFDKKFGRRKWNWYNYFSKTGFHEVIDSFQVESVKKYHGFYISRYEISKSKDGKPISIEKNKKWVNILPDEAVKVAALMEKGTGISSHLMYGAEYDSLIQWIDSSQENDAEDLIHKIIPEGGVPELCVNNICDLFGISDEITQEEYSKECLTVRGGEEYPLKSRTFIYPTEKYDTTTFRVALCLK